MEQKYVASILDTDLYKLTMQQAVLHHFPEAEVVYRFTNRSMGMKFTWPCIQAIIKAVNNMESLSLQPDERQWLEERCPYFQSGYLDYLQRFRFRPREQVTIRFVPSLIDPDTGDLEMELRGLWAETILYETPVMAIVSEAYFTHVEKDWSMDGQEELAYQKGKKMYEGGILLSEFGSRRRRSYETQKLVMEGLIRADKELKGTVPGRLSGTSNVHFAHMFDLTPIGTIAHEWMMGIAAMKGYINSNTLAMLLWEKVYPSVPSNALHIALTDTFTTEAFFQDVSRDVDLIKRWRGLRQDSGDPIQFIKDAKTALESVGISPKDKVIIFSDSLTMDNCFHIKKAADEAGFPAGFGVGTYMTSDFKKSSNGEKSKPMNIVIKLRTIDGNECIKISDDVMKHTGEKASVLSVMEQLNIPSPLRPASRTSANSG